MSKPHGLAPLCAAESASILLHHGYPSVMEGHEASGDQLDTDTVLGQTQTLLHHSTKCPETLRQASLGSFLAAQPSVCLFDHVTLCESVLIAKHQMLDGKDGTEKSPGSQPWCPHVLLGRGRDAEEARLRGRGGCSRQLGFCLPVCLASCPSFRQMPESVCGFKHLFPRSLCCLLINLHTFPFRMPQSERQK